MFRHTLSTLAICLISASTFAAPIEALIVDGQNNHKWRDTTPVLEKILTDTGLFTVDVATSPREGQDNSAFNPDFKNYDVVVLNYNGDLWNKLTQTAFVQYVKNGGGVVVVHAANNPFRDWPEYNEIIGFGGWGGRNKKAGPYIHWVGGELVYDHESDGPGGGHEGFDKFIVDTRDFDHPIMQGMPARWIQSDELYNFMRGPGKNMHLLATAHSKRSRDKGGSGKHEPMLFTIKYGEGDIFHTTLGHDTRSLRDKGFQVMFARGAQWAATGKVTIPIPENMPAILSPTEAIQSFDGTGSVIPLVELYTELSNASNDPAKREAIEQQLVEIITNSNANLLSIQAACDGLGLMGSVNSIPDLAKLLLESPERSDAARLALQRINHPDATGALINALNQLSDGQRAGIINSLGARRDNDAVTPLATIAKQSGDQDASHAIRALGRIGTGDSLNALDALDPTDLVYLKAATQNAIGLLESGDTQRAASVFQSVLNSQSASPALRTAALNGYIVADPQNGMQEVWARLASPENSAAARSILGSLPVNQGFVREIAGRLNQLPTKQQIEVLPLLASMGHVAARPEVLAIAQSGSTDELRGAAVDALAKIPGNEESAAFLATLSTGDGTLAKRAHIALVRAPGTAVDDAIAKGTSRGGADLKTAYINAAADRGLRSANATLIAQASSSNDALQTAAVNALTVLATETEYPQLLDLIGKFPAKLRATAVKAIRNSGKLVSDADRRYTLYASAIDANNAPVQAALLPGVIDMPTDKALQLLKRYAASNTSSVHDASIATLSKWPHENAMVALLDLAEDANSKTHRSALLNGFSTAIKNAPISSIDTQLDQCERALDMGLDLADKKVILATVRNVRDARTLDLLDKIAEDPALREEAEAARPSIQIALMEPPALDASHGKRELSNATDGDPRSRWSTGTSMKPGMWLKLNMRMATTIKSVTLDTTRSGGDYPRGYDVYVSENSNDRGTLVASGKGTKPITIIKLDPPVKGQYITIEQTGENGLFWSVHELSVDHLPEFLEN